MIGPRENLVVRGKTILHTRHLEKSVAQSPFRLAQFHGKSGVISNDVRRIVPSLVVYERPVHELPARIIGVRVVVENIRDAEPANREREPGNILFAGKR